MLGEAVESRPCENWETDKGFPLIPLEQLEAATWRVVDHGPYYVPEPIHLLEGRAVNRGSELAFRFGRGHHALCLVDNMSDVLAFGRSRAQNYRLLLLVRRSAALSLALGITLHYRWLPSEYNPADWPSRVYEKCYEQSSEKIPFLMIATLLHTYRRTI